MDAASSTTQYTSTTFTITTVLKNFANREKAKILCLPFPLDLQQQLQQEQHKSEVYLEMTSFENFSLSKCESVTSSFISLNFWHLLLSHQSTHWYPMGQCFSFWIETTTRDIALVPKASSIYFTPPAFILFRHMAEAVFSHLLGTPVWPGLFPFCYVSPRPVLYLHSISILGYFKEKLLGGGGGGGSTWTQFCNKWMNWWRRRLQLEWLSSRLCRRGWLRRRTLLPSADQWVLSDLGRPRSSCIARSCLYPQWPEGPAADTCYPMVRLAHESQSRQSVPAN